MCALVELVLDASR